MYVLGEVKLPGRYPLDAPTTVMQAISMAGSWNVGAHIEHIVVFRRAKTGGSSPPFSIFVPHCWDAGPAPASEIWVSDADLIIVPKSNILRTDNFIELIFTKGIYGIAPFSGSVSFTNLTTLSH